MADKTDAKFLEDLLLALAERDAVSDSLDGLFKYLVESEEWVLLLIAHIKNPSGPPPVNPSGGSLEFGLVLYWLSYPPAEIQKLMNESAIFKAIWDALQEEAPKTKITPAEYEVLTSHVDKGGVVAEDGTIYGTATYEQLDSMWSLAVVNYALNKAMPSSIHDFGGVPYSGTLTGSGGNGPLIAIIGDWGTGIYDANGEIIPSQEIMAQVRALKPAPDYIIHLGDVYYAGTDLRPMPFEEQLNLLDVWGTSAPRTAFTINSNHEMYGDGSGYFDVAQGSGKPFSHQNRTSYFSLGYGDWAIFGLDSAYYSDAANGDKLYMDGAIGDDAHTQQADWLGTMNLKGKKIVVMTHHNPIAYTGDPASTNTLITQVKKALGRAPDYWYWGHVHMGVAYNQNAACAPTVGRCVGHSAIPFGKPWGMKGKDTYDYCAQTTNTKIPSGIRVLNGFMTIQLNSDGTITEAWYEQGNPNPVWPR